MTKFLGSLMGILAGVVIPSPWLVIGHPNWIGLLVSVQKIVGLSGLAEKSFVIFWGYLPSVVFLGMVSGIMIGRLGQLRWFIYSFLITVIFVRYVVPRLPIVETVFHDAFNELALLGTTISCSIYMVSFFMVTVFLKRYGWVVKS
ncbi:hypothetical protein DU002_10340 [Corallincola holothuriorum]|uniref:Uncharacterized protein n=1 Tax=Corallincola holothuriorum TaxID=2282215 RepID=A0A368NIS6_9GAMM|nr:hypothetical protein [Corallincola holothuriorum]RCU50010.1 hypothetical protein DU002_10340 [Corallincola holothuriorum]